MYASFFGLNEKPFSITPDPRYLYLSRRHAEALAHLLYGITESGGFIQLTGEVGTGKTTVVRSLLEQLPEHAEVALVLNPRLSPDEFLLAICEELHIAITDRTSQKAVVDGLNQHLLQAHAQGQRVVLIVDEAQNLSADVLEQIRLLTNLETAKQKLLQIILIGQPELREVLARSDLRQLAQRITGRYHLEPLEPEELQGYVRHRLEVAGSRAEIFTPGAMKALHRSSSGIPRLINVIADRALLGAWSREETAVSATMVRKAAAEVFGERIRHRRWHVPASAVALLGVAGVAIAIAAGVGATLLREQLTAPPAAAPAETASTTYVHPLPPAAEPVIRPVSTPVGEATVAAVTPKAPLADRLRNGELATGTDAAFAALFGRWQLEYGSEDGPACEQAEAQGLRCLLQRGTWGELVALNRPTLLVLADRSGHEHQVVLSRLEGESAELLAGETPVSVPLGELLPLWYGEYLLLWRPEAGDGRNMTLQSAGTDVLWLRRALAGLRGSPIPPADSSVYDRALEEAVREFQRSSRISVDGIAGAVTLVSLHNALELAGRPKLREDE